MQMQERAPKEKWRSPNNRLEKLFKSVPTYVNREMTLPCATTPLYVAPAYQGDLHNYLRVVTTPAAFSHLSGHIKNLVQIRAAAQENGRVLEADEPIEIGGQRYIVTTKGGGATGYIREGLNALQPTLRDIFGQPLKANPKSQLTAFPFSVDTGWLDQDEAFAEKEQAEKLRAAGVDTEQVLGIFRIDELPDMTGHLQPIAFFQENGTLGENTTPVLLVRIARENLRLQDIARLEDLGHPEAARKLIEHATQQFRAPTEREYFGGMSQKLITELLPLFLQGDTFASHAWQDAARNITILGEEVDVSGIINTQVAYDRSFYLFQLRNHSYRLLTIVLLRLAEQIQRYSPYNFMDAPQVIQEMSGDVLKRFDFTTLERQMKNQQNGAIKKSLRREVAEDLKATLEKVEVSYRRRELSTSIFRSHVS